jgi:hypothetical protein
VDFGEYLASIDWFGAVAVGAGMVVIGLVVLRFLMASTSEVGHMLPGAGRAASQAVLDARGLPIDSWVCRTCKSVNTPNAKLCYRGCGPREALAEPPPPRPDVQMAGIDVLAADIDGVLADREARADRA